MKIPTAKGSDLKASSNEYLHEPGTYHLSIDHFKENLSSKDEPLDGHTIEMTVLDGSVKDQCKKKVSVTLWDLTADKTVEEQALKVKALTNFFVASNVIVDPNQLGDELEINPTESAGHQIVMKLVRPRKKNDNGKWIDDSDSKFLQISFSDIWHVDDPEVASIPKHQGALKMIDPKYRHEAAWFAFKAEAMAEGSDGSDYDDI